MTAPTKVYRLDNDVYAKLAAQFRAVKPNEQTTSLQIAYALGVEAVLKALREDIVIETR